MANIRCFDSSKPNLTASELSNEKRKQIIYNEIRQNVEHFNTANPVKQNGKEYNSQTIVNPTCDISFGYVEYAESYAILDDVREGAALCNPVQISTPITTVQYAACTNICSNTFANGFQDTGQTGGGSIVSIDNVQTTVNEELKVSDATTHQTLQQIETVIGGITVTDGYLNVAIANSTGIQQVKDASSNDYLKLIASDLSGITVTNGYLNVAIANSTGIQQVKDASGNDYLKLIASDLSGITVTDGYLNVAIANSTGIQQVKDASSNDYLKLIVADLSGITVTNGYLNVAMANSTGIQQVKDASSNDYLKLIASDLSGITITNGYLNVAMANTTGIQQVKDASSNDYLKLIVADLSGITITNSNLIVKDISANEYLSETAAAIIEIQSSLTAVIPPPEDPILVEEMIITTPPTAYRVAYVGSTDWNALNSNFVETFADASVMVKDYTYTLAATTTPGQRTYGWNMTSFGAPDNSMNTIFQYNGVQLPATLPTQWNFDNYFFSQIPLPANRSYTPNGSCPAWVGGGTDAFTVNVKAVIDTSGNWNYSILSFSGSGAWCSVAGTGVWKILGTYFGGVSQDNDLVILCTFAGGNLTATSIIPSTYPLYGSLNISAVNKYLTFPVTPLPLGGPIPSGGFNFTVEAWIYPIAAQQTDINTNRNFILFNQGGPFNSAEWGFFYNGFSIGMLWDGYSAPLGDNTVSTTIGPSPIILINQWSHVAFCVSTINSVQNCFQMFVNGVSKTSTTTLKFTGALAPSATIYIGAFPQYKPTGFVGNITNVRLHPTQALYSSDFTPQYPLENVPGTSLLLLTYENEPTKDSSAFNYPVSNVTGIAYQNIRPTLYPPSPPASVIYSPFIDPYVLFYPTSIIGETFKALIVGSGTGRVTPFNSINTNIVGSLPNGTNNIGSVTIKNVNNTSRNELLVYDSSANVYLQNLDTNANLTTSDTTIATLIYAASSFTGSFSLGTGPFRFRNATFLGSCNATTAPYTNPMFVIQYSTTGTDNWFSDGIEPSFFVNTTVNATADWQFCFQRSNVPTQYIRLFFVNATTFNSLQLVLTKN